MNYFQKKVSIWKQEVVRGTEITCVWTVFLEIRLHAVKSAIYIVAHVFVIIWCILTVKCWDLICLYVTPSNMLFIHVHVESPSILLVYTNVFRSNCLSRMLCFYCRCFTMKNRKYIIQHQSGFCCICKTKNFVLGWFSLESVTEGVKSFWKCWQMFFFSLN